jgi:hypothetical protein
MSSDDLGNSTMQTSERKQGDRPCRAAFRDERDARKGPELLYADR